MEIETAELEANFEPISYAKVYELLGHSKMDWMSGIYELIDNAYSSCVDDKVNIKIRVIGPWNNHTLDLKSANLTIEDDGCGIAPEKFAECLTPGNMPGHKGPLNEFGVGLKNSMMTLGCTVTDDGVSGFEIISKTALSNTAFRINKVSTRKKVIIKPNNKLFNNGHGTIIQINNLKPTSNFPTKKEHFTALRYSLGMRYQFFLNDDFSKFKKMTIKFSLEDMSGNAITDANGNSCVYDIKSISPVLSIAEDSKRKTLFSKVKNEWQAAVSASYKPSLEELETYTTSEAKDQKSTNHPYWYRSNKVDIIYKGIVIQQMPLAEFSGKSEPNTDRITRAKFLYIRVLLEDGFLPINTKNEIKQTTSFKELRVAITAWLASEGFTSVRHHDGDLSETKVSDSLEKIVRVKSKDYKREAPISGLELRPDYTMYDLETIWELKVDEANTAQVMQLFGYCMMMGWKKGVLIAPSFGKNAESTVKECNSKYNLELELHPLSQYL